MKEITKECYFGKYFATWYGSVPYDFTSKKIPSNKGNFREMKSGYFERIAQKTKENFRIKKKNLIVQSLNRRDNV